MIVFSIATVCVGLGGALLPMVTFSSDLFEGVVVVGAWWDSVSYLFRDCVERLMFSCDFANWNSLPAGSVVQNPPRNLKAFATVPKHSRDQTCCGKKRK